MQELRGVHLLWTILAVCLVACAAPSPKQSVTPPLPPAPGSPPIQAPRVTSASWSFHSGEQCIATASSSAVAVAVAATDRTVTWTVRGRLAGAVSSQRNLPLAFSGTNASWTVPARRVARGQLIASIPLSEYAVGRVLLMLRGGTLRLGTGGSAPTIRLPGSGPDGTQWFKCVRKRLAP